jgi:hypothetical protein
MVLLLLLLTVCGSALNSALALLLLLVVWVQKAYIQSIERALAKTSRESRDDKNCIRNLLDLSEGCIPKEQSCKREKV